MEHQVEHPGTIVFVDADQGTERVTDVALVPRTIAFAHTDKGQVPVVRVVARRRGGALEIQSFGVDGAFLAVTMQALPPGA